jgi:hypothetical protein
MSLESDIVAALTSLVSGRVFPEFAPYSTAKPFITYQQVGGAAENFLEATVVGKKNARIQINCWTTTRQSANNLARQVEGALVPSALKAYVLGAFIAVYEEDVEPPLYGTHQDFSVWY